MSGRQLKICSPIMGLPDGLDQQPNIFPSMYVTWNTLKLQQNTSPLFLFIMTDFQCTMSITGQFFHLWKS